MMKRKFISLFVLLMTLALVACTTPTCSHVDTDGDGSCDKCYLVIEEKECKEHIDSNNDYKCDECGEQLEKPACTEHVDSNNDHKCDNCGADVPGEQPNESIKDQFDCISIAEAIELAHQAGTGGTLTKYYVYGKITEVSNGTYGSMTITDETGSLYVYGVYGSDEVTRYDALADRPIVGDEVVLYGILKTYNDSPEMDRGYLQALKHGEIEVDDSNYPEDIMPLEEIRGLEAGELVRAQGVVAQITYANGMNPNGFYLVDGTDSIYVYGGDVASMVKVGNIVTIVGERTYYILDTEVNSAKKYGYQGCCQIANAKLVDLDKEVTTWDHSWVQEATIKELMDTPFTTDITTTIYKVNALVSKVEGTGFINYYFNDLDGVTGSYTYTQCGGSDFEWLDEFDGKICTVYLSVINAKATSSGCVWRLLPIEVKDEGYTFDQKDGAKFVLDYFGLGQYLDYYESDPEVKLHTTVDVDLIDIKGAKISYSSSDTNVVYFEEVEGELVLHTKEVGKATITITVEYNGVIVEGQEEITVSTREVFDTVTVKEAIDSVDGTEVILQGIVASSLVNQSGFYLIDDTGVIAVIATADQVALLSAGDEVVVKGTKTHRTTNKNDSIGQINIDGATILANYYGGHEYSTSTFDYSKTLADIASLDHTEDHSTEVYVVKAVVVVVETPFYTSIKVQSKDGTVSLNLYSSSAAQYQFLHQFNGQEVTLEIAPCNWNDKTSYAGCVLAVVTENGKVINSLNFQ